MVAEREVKLRLVDDPKDPGTAVLTASHRAWRVLEQISGRSFSAWLRDWVIGGGIGQIQEAAYALTASYRRALRIGIDFDDFLDRLPAAEDPEWEDFKSAVEAVIDEAFFPHLLALRNQTKELAAMVRGAETPIPPETSEPTGMSDET